MRATSHTPADIPLKVFSSTEEPPQQESSPAKIREEVSTAKPQKPLENQNPHAQRQRALIGMQRLPEKTSKEDAFNQLRTSDSKAQSLNSRDEQVLTQSSGAESFVAPELKDAQRLRHMQPSNLAPEVLEELLKWKLSRKNADDRSA